MTWQITSFESTPNPNAVKCWLDRRISERPRSFRGADELGAGAASDDPLDRLAAALFADANVTSVLFLDDWVTVNKAPDARWPTVRRAVRRILAAGPQDASDPADDA